MKATVVIPTFNGRSLLTEALEHLAAQTVPHDVVVVDNGSTDGTAEHVSERFPDVRVVALDENLGFGRAVNLGVAQASTDVVVLVNNDVLCPPEFLAELLAPFADQKVDMVAGVLVQHDRPDLVDSAGIELDTTLRSWDMLWNRPTAELDTGQAPDDDVSLRVTLLAALARLDPPDRAVLVLRYWEDLDAPATAVLVGSTPAAVRTRCSRALGRLREVLGDDLADLPH